MSCTALIAGNEVDIKVKKIKAVVMILSDLGSLKARDRMKLIFVCEM